MVFWLFRLMYQVDITKILSDGLGNILPAVQKKYFTRESIGCFCQSFLSVLKSMENMSILSVGWTSLRQKCKIQIIFLSVRHPEYFMDANEQCNGSIGVKPLLISLQQPIWSRVHQYVESDLTPIDRID